MYIFTQKIYTEIRVAFYFIKLYFLITTAPNLYAVNTIIHYVTKVIWIGITL